MRPNRKRTPAQRGPGRCLSTRTRPAAHRRCAWLSALRELGRFRQALTRPDSSLGSSATWEAGGASTLTGVPKSE